LTRIRTLTLLLTGFALLLIWYFMGGKDLIEWWIAAQATAAGGWDISGAYREERPHPLLAVWLIAGTMLFVAGAVGLVMDGIRRTRKAMND